MPGKRAKRSPKRSSSRKTSAKRKKPNYRSGFEALVGKVLTGTGAKHEPYRMKYTVPERTANYLPDFILPDGTVVEAKGRFTAPDRKKHILLREQYPDTRFIIVFMNPSVRLNKISRTTYAKWCDKHGMEWCGVNDLKKLLSSSRA